MIVGTGIDICPVERIEKSLFKFGERFEKRIATMSEIHRCNSSDVRRIARYAQVFAVKEATVKALGTGMRYGIGWQDMELCHYETGQPYIKLLGNAQLRLEQLTPDNYRAYIDVSLTDDAGTVHAMVVISVTPQLTPERTTGQMPNFA